MIKTFCERLKELRKEKNLSTIELADILGVGHSTVSRWENGVMTPTIDHLYNIAVYFKVTTDYLVGLEN